jgi:hypothetical protein
MYSSFQREEAAIVRTSFCRVKAMKNPALNALSIERHIFPVREQRVMLDFHLADMYGVATKSLNLAVRRNYKRFPPDFMFQLSAGEVGHVEERLRFQFETSRPSGHGGRRYLPYAFTEQGVAMLSSVLRSDRAIQTNIVIMRAFVKLREILSTHKELALKLSSVELRLDGHDHEIEDIFEAIRQLVAPSDPTSKRRIGFGVDET